MFKHYKRGLIGLVATSLTLFSSPALAQGRTQQAPGQGATRTAPAPAIGKHSVWGELALPPNFQGPGTVRGLGTCVVFQTLSEVYLWSGITNNWSIVPVTPGAFVSQFNAYVIIEDGPTVHGWASRTGTVESLQLPSTPLMHNGSGTSNWMSIATLGTEAWSFSAFRGQWNHQQLASATPFVDVSQSVALVDDGVNVYAAGSYYGDFVSTPSISGGSYGVAGSVGVVWSPTEAAAFSAHHNEWTTRSFTNASLLTANRGYAMFQDGLELVAYSGAMGSFQAQTVPAGFLFDSGRYVTSATAGNQVIGYSSGTGTFATRTFASAPVVTLDHEVFAVQDSSGVTGFSLVTGEFSDTVQGSFTVTINDSMLWIDDGTDGYGFCTTNGTWSQAPDFGPQSVVTVLRNVVVLGDAQAHHGFAGRTGEWASQATSAATTSLAPSSGDMFVAFDGTDTHLFDPILVRWFTYEGVDMSQTHDLWRQTFMATDGTRAYGYGLMNKEWTSIPIQGAVLDLDANSSCGFVTTTTHLYPYSANGSLSTLSRYPEFSRLQPLSVPVRLMQAAPAGSTVLSMFATRSDNLPFQPYGTLHIDGGTIFSFIPLGMVPASGLLDTSLDLSFMPALQGTVLHIQNIISAPNGSRWLTNSIAPIIF